MASPKQRVRIAFRGMSLQTNKNYPFGTDPPINTLDLHRKQMLAIPPLHESMTCLETSLRQRKVEDLVETLPRYADEQSTLG